MRKDLEKYVCNFYSIDSELDHYLYQDMFNYTLTKKMVRESIKELYKHAREKKMIFVHSIFGWGEYLTTLLNEDGESEIRELVRDYMLIKYGFSKKDETEFSRYFKENNIF